MILGHAKEIRRNFTMRNKNTWLASMLAIAIALSDCGGITILAAENTIQAESTVSENNTLFDETPENEAGKGDADSIPSDFPVDQDTYEEEKPNTLPDADTVVNTDKTEETDPETELPALHIGQVPEGEALPPANDSTFRYDLPVSFETAERLILFSNYTLEEMPEATETGKLEWHILRGKKGLKPGSTSLLDETDDWDGFEEVSSSPYFSMEEIMDTESEYFRMIALTPEETVSVVNSGENPEGEEASGNFDYYIRAAYYPETGNTDDVEFYAAATVPFAPKNDADADVDQAAEDVSDAGQLLTDSTSEESSVSENSADHDEPAGDHPTKDDSASAEECIVEEASKDTISENTDTGQAEAPVATLSENTSTPDISSPGEDKEPTAPEPDSDGKLILYKGAGTDDANMIAEKERITLAPGDIQQITAKAVPEMPQEDLLWESSDETVAVITAGERGTATITAAAEGYAKITVSCRGITACAIVDVVLDKDNPDYEKLLDLSGDIRVAGFEKEREDLVYNGQKITQNLRVYHKNTLLKEKTDYTLNYKNNINAAEWNSIKAPSVTINLKGQYQGSVTLYFTIKPLDISTFDMGYEQTVNYSRTLRIPSPVLTFGRKKLSVNKDFVCDYATPGKGMEPLPADYKNGDLYVENKPYSYTVTGTGNFSGSFPMRLVVLKDKMLNFSSASIKLDKKQYEYHGVPLKKSDILIEEVKVGGQILSANLYDYEVSTPGIESAYVTVSPNDAGRAAGYRGCKKMTIKLAGDRQLKDAVPGASWRESIPFSQKALDKSGGIFQTGTSLLAFTGAGETEPLTEGTDYTLKYGNAKKAGNVTVTFTGKGRYKGSLRLTYTITPNTNIKIIPGKNVADNNGTYTIAYQKNGAVPDLILKDQDHIVLKNKTDYAIKCIDNKTPGTPMTCEIIGKGNYKGYQKSMTFMVTKADISKCTISVPDKPYSDSPNKWQSNVTIKDTNGKKLTAGKDYAKELSYSYSNEQSPPAGTAIEVTAKGLGFYEGSSITGTYRIFEKNISTLKVVIDPQEYTGEEIKLTPIKDIHLYANPVDAKNQQNEIKETCYEIIESEYKNNINAGTAKVTLHGIGTYGGTKTYSFKIQKKQYLMNHVKGITLDKTSLKVSLMAKETERVLTATIIPESPDQILANPTVLWTSSNNDIATVVPVKADEENTQQNPLVSSVIINAKKTGTVTITATAQDGNKKAKCTVTISIPVLKQANQTIEGKVGDTYQLTFAGFDTQEMNTDGIEFESNNPNIVSVNKKGLLTMNRVGAATIHVYMGSRKNIQKCFVIVEGNVDDPESDSRALVYHQAEGCTDDTPYINKMLRDWEWNPARYDYMYIPEGVYHIDAVKDFGGIVLTDNQTLIMSPKAKLVAIKNSKPNSQVINVFGRSNVTISGGQIIGERDSHSGSSGEWGHGIAIFGGTNIFIKDIEISKCFGDGIYLGLYNGWDDNGNKKEYLSSGITIKNCNIHDNRRNNLSITDVSNVTIRNCKFSNARGTAPQFGIDIEPNSGKTCRNVRISDSTFQGNAGGTIQILGQLNAHVKDVTIENCTGDKKPVIWQGFGGSVSGVTEKGNSW